VNPDMKEKFEISRYRSLGLVANPFALSDTVSDFDPIDLEVASQTNALLGTLDAAADAAQAKPIVVFKSPQMPAYYPNRAISRVERSMATDDSLDVLHAYVLMFMMRLGRVRSTLQIVAERIAFRDFNTTLALYVERIIAEPDESLIAYQVLGSEALAAYQARFAENPTDAVADVFGVAKVERRPELAEVTDTRPMDLLSDVEEGDDAPELDGAIGDAPGTEVILSDEQTPEEDIERAILDYIVEHTKVHLSPVIARALRVYKDRGLVALTAELTITKAPRKTLSALVRFARIRFRKIVLIYDGFDNWAQTPPEVRSQITGTLSELRWMLESDAVVAIMVERGGVPELEEQFGAGTHVDWDFPGLIALEESPDALDPQMIDRWLASAAMHGTAPLTVEDPVLSAMLAEAEGSLKAFSLAAGVAIENAAQRGASALDEEALEAGRAATWEEADSK
jgi:hypothetical protein